VAGAAFSALAGCHTSKLADTTITVEASALATFQEPDLGSGLNVILSDQMHGCPLSENATISLNGISAPFGTCLFGANSGPPSAAAGTFTGNPSFGLKVSDGGDSAEMDVGGLVPGVEAILLSPADGQVAPGGDLQVAVPPAMQNQVPVAAQFIYTDGGAAYEGGSCTWLATSTSHCTAHRGSTTSSAAATGVATSWRSARPPARRSCTLWG
jgi:hypothetical protein